MNILFLHDAFPAQFGRLGLELHQRYGWHCSYLIQNFSSCPLPTAEMLRSLEIHRYFVPPSTDGNDEGGVPWPRSYGRFVEQCRAVYDAIRQVGHLRPDLVVANGGRGAPTLFVPEATNAKILTYCEYYFARSRADLTYRIDLPPAEPAPFFPRVINAPTLASLAQSVGGYSATRRQRDSFPERWRSRIEVHFDGVDVDLYRPGPRTGSIAGRSVPPDTKVVTFVARGLESMRGFDIFVKVAKRILRERKDVLFVVAGGDHTYYGWDSYHTGPGKTFREWTIETEQPDLDHFVFLGQIAPEELADVLRRSDLHLYLTVPFVVSWSLFNALSTGLVVLGSDIDAVREVVEPGVSGLLEPLFDADRLAERALEVLADPAAFAPLGAAARQVMEERYSVDVSIPPIRDFFERAVNMSVPD
ncbi:MAG: glycosyltransferase [Isosphaeraceae bacterium]|nr:glycosyltransferase [Isosphaeraceae bacterium]